MHSLYMTDINRYLNGGIFSRKLRDMKLYEDRLKGFAFYMRADWRTEQFSAAVRIDVEAA